MMMIMVSILLWLIVDFSLSNFLFSLVPGETNSTAAMAAEVVAPAATEAASEAPRNVNEVLRSSARLPPIETSMARGKLSWMAHFQQWRDLKLDSFCQLLSWPNAMKQAFKKRTFLQGHLERYAETNGLSLAIAARRLDAERGNQSMDAVWKQLHESAGGILHRAKRRRVDSPPMPPCVVEMPAIHRESTMSIARPQGPYTAIVSPPARPTTRPQENRLLQGTARATTGMRANPRYSNWESSTRPAIPRHPRPVSTTNRGRHFFQRENHRRPRAQDLDPIQRALLYQEDNARNWERGGIRSTRAMADELDDHGEEV